eukprot:g1234.t1
MVDKLTNVESYRTVTVLDEALESLKLLSVVDEDTTAGVSHHDAMRAMREAEERYILYRGRRGRPEEGKDEELDSVARSYRQRVRDACRLVRGDDGEAEGKSGGDGGGYGRDAGFGDAIAALKRELSAMPAENPDLLGERPPGASVHYGLRLMLANLAAHQRKVVEDFSTTVEQKEFREAHMVEVVERAKQAKAQLEELQQQMRIQRGAKDMDRSTQSEIIAKLSGELLEVKQIAELERNGLERRTKAVEEANLAAHEQTMAQRTVEEKKVTETHLKTAEEQATEEEKLRKQKNKKDMELTNLIAKYDADMGELQAKIEEDGRQHRQELERLSHLSEIFARLDRDRNNALAEKAAEDAERKMIRDAMARRAKGAAKIQALYRGVYCRVAMNEKKNKKKKKGGKKKGGKKKGKKK